MDTAIQDTAETGWNSYLDPQRGCVTLWVGIIGVHKARLEFPRFRIARAEGMRFQETSSAGSGVCLSGDGGGRWEVRDREKALVGSGRNLIAGSFPIHVSGGRDS